MIAERVNLARAAAEALDKCADGGETVFISPISAWEIGLAIVKGRYKSNMPPRVWFSRFVSTGTTALAGMTPEILIESSFLPGKPPRDPADRIIIATAREYGYCVVTCDGEILDYAAEGHVQALGC
jgi:PIN domain nuclease of toxin-antitoxin system